MKYLIDFLVEVRDRTLEKKEKTKLINELDKEINKWSSYKVRGYWYKVKARLSSQELFDFEMQTELIQLVLAIRKGSPERMVITYSNETS